MCLSDTALTAFEKDGHYAAVIGEANLNAQNHAFCSFLCVLALSNVIGCTINSYFPISDDRVPPEKWNCLEKMFNCCVNPRRVCNTGSEKIDIFRCAAMPVNYLQTRKIPKRKNDYVTLCQPVVISSGQPYFKPVIPNVPIAVSADAGSDATAASLNADKGLTATVNQPLQTGKRRQLSLDQLFPKKRNP